MSYEATFEDWLALLGTAPQVQGVLKGTTRLDDGIAALRARRATYPNVSQDYVAILDEVADRLDALRPTIAEQAEQLEAFVEAALQLQSELWISRPEWIVPIVRDRLLTTAERVNLEHIQGEMEGAIEDHAEEVDALEEELEALEEEAQRLQEEIDEELARLEEEAEGGEDSDDVGEDWDGG